MKFETEFELSIGMKVLGALVIVVTGAIFAGSIYNVFKLGDVLSWVLLFTTAYVFFSCTDAILTGGRLERALWRRIRGRRD